MVAAHLDGVAICGRDNIQVQVAISQVAIADRLQAVKIEPRLTVTVVAAT
jgi:hypothetical protein